MANTIIIPPIWLWNPMYGVRLDIPETGYDEDIHCQNDEPEDFKAESVPDQRGTTGSGRSGGDSLDGG